MAQGREHDTRSLTPSAPLRELGIPAKPGTPLSPIKTSWMRLIDIQETHVAGKA